MSQNVRQNNLFAAEDFTKLYKTFKNVDFTAYDLASIQQSLVDSLRLNYPETFNDYIQSSEFIAHIKLLSYISSSIAFRADLNARENILDTAERRESIIRLAKMINYYPSRNIPLSGIAKIVAIKTNEPLTDPIGNDLQNKTIFWDDPNNKNSYDNFITIMNSALSSSTPFGKPYKNQTINGIPTSLYQLSNSKGVEVAYPFSTFVDGATMVFDVANPDLSDDGLVFEKHPNFQSAFNLIYRNDGQGLGSPNTGFFTYFRQGNIIKKDFLFEIPLKNRVTEIDVNDVNDTDVYLQEINQQGEVLVEWTKIPNISGGTNLIYNAINLNNRTIYSVTSDVNDKIKLNFTDGNFGDVPTGIFRAWVRPSANRNTSIRPDQMFQKEIKISYVNKEGKTYTLTLTFNLQYTVNNASTSETLEQVKTRAPQVYYTQDRMVNNEDYNVYPLTKGNEIVKIRTINRTHAGHSRYIDINDPTGYHQNLTIYSDDGALYKDKTIPTLAISINDTIEENAYDVIKQFENFIKNEDLVNFYYDVILNQYKSYKNGTYMEGDGYNKFNVFSLCTNTRLPLMFLPKPESEYDNSGVFSYYYVCNQLSDSHEVIINGLAFINVGDKIKLTSTGSSLQPLYATIENVSINESMNQMTLTLDVSVMRGIWNIIMLYDIFPETPNTELISGRLIFLNAGSKIRFVSPTDSTQSVYATVKTIYTDTDNASIFTLDKLVRKGWLINEIFPAFDVTFSDNEINQIATSVKTKNSFGLSYDLDNIQNPWHVVNNFNDVAEYQYKAPLKDWLFIANYVSDYTTSTRKYQVSSRGTQYIFESYKDVNFFFDVEQYDYDIITGRAKRDTIEITTQNKAPSKTEYWQYKSGKWVNLEDTSLVYETSQYIPLLSRNANSDTVNITHNVSNVSITNGLAIISGAYEGAIVQFTYNDAIEYMKNPVVWNIYGNVYQEDGYLDQSKVIVIPADVDNDGVPDYMFPFSEVSSEDNLVFLEQKPDLDGYTTNRLWKTEWINYIGVNASNINLSYEDLVKSSLFLCDVTNITAIKVMVNQIILDHILNSDITNINDVVTGVDSSVFYTKIKDSLGDIITNNSDSMSIMQQISIDYKILGRLLQFNEVNKLTNGGVSIEVSTVINDINMNPVSFIQDNNHTVKIGRSLTLDTTEQHQVPLSYKWTHFAPADNRIDPSTSNIMDMIVLTNSYFKSILTWKSKGGDASTFPSPPTSEELRLQFDSIKQAKMQSDQIIFQSAKFKLLFGKQSNNKLRATFKVVKQNTSSISDNEVKTKIVNAIDAFFSVQNWEFGESFYYTELAAYIHRTLAKYIASIVIVPMDKESKFGDLFQIKSEPTELFLSVATIDDVEVVTSLTENNMRA